MHYCLYKKLIQVTELERLLIPLFNKNNTAMNSYIYNK